MYIGTAIYISTKHVIRQNIDVLWPCWCLCLCVDNLYCTCRHNYIYIYKMYKIVNIYLYAESGVHK